MRVEVITKDNALGFPSMCACCGGPADTQQSVAHSERSGNRTTIRSWKLPYCTGCKQHLELQNWGPLWGSLIILTLGLFYLLVYRPFIYPQRQAASNALRKPGCVHLEGVTYVHGWANDPGGGRVAFHRHTFDRVAEPFAKAMAAGNTSAQLTG